MDIRHSFSKLKKTVKHRLTGNKRKPDKTEADADGESVDPANSLPGPAPHVLAGDGEGSGADPDGQQVCSADQLTQPDEPEPVPVGESENNQGGVDVEGMEVSRRYSHLHSNVEVAVGSGPGQGGDDSDEEEGEQFYSCSSAPSTPRSGEPESSWA